LLKPTDSALPRTIAVIGGGLSGLTTAFYLKRLSPNVRVSLFEASDHLGGVIGTESIDVPDVGHFTIDCGADMFATDPPAAMELCRDLGVDDQLIMPDGEKAGAMIVHRGRLVPIPDGFVLMRATKLWQMVTTPLLSVSGKLRFLAERFIAPHPTLQAADGTGDVSVGEFVRYRMGQETLDHLVAPLVAGIYTADIEKLSLRATMGPIVEMVQRHGSLAKATLSRKREQSDQTERKSAGARYAKFRGFPRGMVQLIETLSEAIGSDSIQLNTPVQSLQFDREAETPWKVQFASNGASQETQFDAVVLAVPPTTAAKLLSTIDEPSIVADCRVAAEAFAGIECASAAIAVMAVKKSLVKRLPQRFGFVVPEVENRRILATSFASHKYPIRCPQDHTIIRTFVGGSLHPELLEKSDAEIIDLVKEELADLIGLSGEPTITRVVRWNHAMPQYHVGHLDRVEQIETAIGRISSLALAGNALHGVGIAPVVRNCRRVAEELVGTQHDSKSIEPENSPG
jgi:oxygen-dependent protoporphyrinogen oxidase